MTAEVKIYTNLIYGSGDIHGGAFRTREEAWEDARIWLYIERGATQEDEDQVFAMSEDEVENAILDYDHVAYIEIAEPRTLY